MRASGTPARRLCMNAAATEAITGSADTIAITTTISSLWCLTNAMLPRKNPTTGRPGQVTAATFPIGELPAKVAFTSRHRLGRRDVSVVTKRRRRR